MSTAVEEDLSSLEQQFTSEATEDEENCWSPDHSTTKATHTQRHGGCLVYLCTACIKASEAVLLLAAMGRANSNVECKVCRGPKVHYSNVIITPINK